MAEEKDTSGSPLGWRPPVPTRAFNGHAQVPFTPDDEYASQSRRISSSNGNGSPLAAFPHDFFPGQPKSLRGVAFRSFLLGIVIAFSCTATAVLAWYGVQLWRAGFFLASLSLFHFLEYYCTAAYNTRAATTSAFLLSQNGLAYNAANAAAFIECILTYIFFPLWQSAISNKKSILWGLAMMLVGQVTRSTAMAHAGSNFNHTVQTRRSEGHVLVKEGIYRWLRHPSYFGFFWWGLGTQMVLGNAVCFVAYMGILWTFFYRRTRKEEEYLVKFFGKEYEEYRNRTPVGIPFIP